MTSTQPLGEIMTRPGERKFPPRVDAPPPPPPPPLPPESLERLREVAIMRPGDTLIIRVDPATPVEAADRMREELARYLRWPPGANVRVVFVLAEQMAIHRQEEPDV